MVEKIELVQLTRREIYQVMVTFEEEVEVVAQES